MASKDMKRSNKGSISPPPLRRQRRKDGGVGGETKEKQEENAPQMAYAADQTTETKTTLLTYFPAKEPKEPPIINWRVVNDTCLAGKTRSFGKELENAKHGGIEEQDTKGPLRRLAAFDLDSTLIETKSGAKFPTNGDDWQWWSPNVPLKLRELHDQGYLLAIITNQGAVVLKKKSKKSKTDVSEPKSLTNLKQRLTGVVKALELPMSIYAATAKDGFRKPGTGMWKELVGKQDLDLENDLNHEQCFFVGDAAGRPQDHSNVDRELASNIGIPFKTPEEFFLGEEEADT
ncbi:hypothetical protein KEM55_004100 [Ascosphaera atra]|nr:hypothetical protein KEM55_004100 [Ascosphaera atra]